MTRAKGGQHKESIVQKSVKGEEEKNPSKQGKSTDPIISSFSFPIMLDFFSSTEILFSFIYKYI